MEDEKNASFHVNLKKLDRGQRSDRIAESLNERYDCVNGWPMT